MKKDTPNKKTILVADDEQFITHIFAKGLNHKYNVIIAKDGIEALEKIKKEKPDLIILDVSMPNMNGIEVSWRLKREDGGRYRDIPIIMLTSKDRLGEVGEGITAGANFYVPKPFNFARLCSKIELLLEGKNREQA